MNTSTLGMTFLMIAALTSAELVLPPETAAQTQKTEFSVLAGSIDEVVVTGHKRVEIKAVTGDVISGTSWLVARGKTWGFRFPASRGVFAFKYEQKGRTLFIETPSEFHYAMVGASTYNEAIETVLYVPEGLPIRVENAGELITDAAFNRLDVVRAERVFIPDASTASFRQLSLQAGENLWINGRSAEKTFRLQSTGNRNASIRAKEILLNARDIARKD